MSETKTYIFPNEGSATGGSSGILGLLAPMLQQRGIDPNLLLTMNKGNSGGFGGEGGWFIWVIFLFFLMGWGGNGWGGNRGAGTGGVENQINNDYGRDLLLQAINGNRSAIDTLSSTLNCSVGQIQSSINAVMTQIQGVGNQIGMTGQQIINSIQQGNSQIATQIADCCCKTQNAIIQQGYENQLSICNQTNALVNNANQNALSLRDGAAANTQAILGKLDAMQNQSLLDKIDALREKNSTLATQLNNEHQTLAIQQSQAQMIAPVNAALGDLSTRLAAIECRQPLTFPMPYYPATGSYVPVNYGVNVNPLATGTGCCA